MARSKIAEQYVEFSVDGVDRAEQQTRRGVTRMGVLAQYLQTRFNTLTQVVQRWARVISVAGMANIGYFTRGAAQGTIEGDRLARSFEYLTRVIGQQFAPYVRVLSATIFKLAEAYRSLDPQLKANIARWALIGTGIAAVVVLLPVLKMGFLALAGVFALLTSPITLTIAAIAALVVAFSQLFDFSSEGASSASASMTDSAMGWADSVINLLKAITKAFGQFFNWVMKGMAELSSGLAVYIANLGEAMGALPEGTWKNIFDEWERGDGIKPLTLIDLPAIDRGFEKLRNGIKTSIPQVKQFLGNFAQIGDILGGIMDEAKKPGGFQMKLNVEFESMQGTFDRLQKAFAEGNSQDIFAAQLQEQKGINQGLDKLINAVKGINIAPVGP